MREATQYYAKSKQRDQFASNNVASTVRQQCEIDRSTHRTVSNDIFELATGDFVDTAEISVSCSRYIRDRCVINQI